MVWRGWIVLIGFAVGGVLLGLALAGLTPTKYEAETLLVVVPANASNSDLAVGYARIFSRLASDRAVLTPVVDSATGSDFEHLAKSISVDVSPNTPMFELIVSESDPELAADLANSVAVAISGYTLTTQDRTGYRAEVLTEALPPTKASSPNPRLNAALGGSIGFLAAGLLVLAMASIPRDRDSESAALDVGD